MADKEPDKLAAKIPAKIPAKETKDPDPERRKRKTSHLSSTQIEAALIADDTAADTPKSATTSSARRKLTLPTKISDGSADLFDDSLVSPISESDMPTMSASMLEAS